MLVRAWIRRAALVGVVLAAAGLTALGEEVTVQNDSLVGGAQGSIIAGFVEGEQAAAWLTSPCDGNIVAVQVFWRSYFGGEPPTLGQAIYILSSGAFPNPGPLKQNGVAPYQDAVLEGPVLNDGVLNEFRYIDEQQTIPLNVPVQAGETFIVSYQFFDDVPALGPSVIVDTNGCQNGRNAVLAVGQGWINPCALGMSGDFVIRAVVDCQEPTGACCTPQGTCLDNMSAGDCTGAGFTFFVGQSCVNVTCPEPTGACCNGTGGCLDGQTQAFCETVLAGIYAGNGTSCASDVCALGACCLPDGSCLANIALQCADLGGVYQGVGTSCTPNPCPQPTGACCVGQNCVPNQTQANCAGFGGTWVGAFTTCGPPNPCAPPPVCRGDSNCDDTISWRDIDYFVAAMNDNTAAWTALFAPGAPTCAFANNDVNADGTVSWRDIDPLVAVMNTNCP